MYRQTYQKGLFPVFYSAGLDPLKNWNIHRKDGHIKRIYEPDLRMLVMEMRARNTTLHYISCPKLPNKSLAIRMPIVNFLIKNLNSCFSFEIRIRDDSNQNRRFRCANYVRKSLVSLTETTIPLSMRCSDWVLIYFNLAEFTRRCYDTNYLETERIQINGNIHLRRIYFSDEVIEYNKLPKDYQLSMPLKEKPRKPPAGRPPSPIGYRGRTSKRSSKKTETDSSEGVSDRTSLKSVSNLQLETERSKSEHSLTEKVVEVEVSTTALGDAKLSASKTLITKQASNQSIAVLEESPRTSKTVRLKTAGVSDIESAEKTADVNLADKTADEPAAEPSNENE